MNSVAIRTAITLWMLCLPLHAHRIDVTYDISYWFLDHIASTTLHFESDQGRYHIAAKAQLHGIAAAMARHHTEEHNSSGSINSSRKLIPQRYTVVRSLDGYRREQEYHFDYRRHRILLHQHETWIKYEKRFDPTSMHFVNTDKSHQRSFARQLRFWAGDDLLSLYFNARNRLMAMQPGETLFFHAVGSRNGIVKVQRTTEPHRYIVFINQDIFRSKEGKLFITLDKNYFVKEAVLKDVFLFGDLTVKRMSLERSPEGL